MEDKGYTCCRSGISLSFSGFQYSHSLPGNVFGSLLAAPSIKIMSKADSSTMSNISFDLTEIVKD